MQDSPNISVFPAAQQLFPDNLPAVQTSDAVKESGTVQQTLSQFPVDSNSRAHLSIENTQITVSQQVEESRTSVVVSVESNVESLQTADDDALNKQIPQDVEHKDSVSIPAVSVAVVKSNQSETSLQVDAMPSTPQNTQTDLATPADEASHTTGLIKPGDASSITPNDEEDTADDLPSFGILDSDNVEQVDQLAPITPHSLPSEIINESIKNIASDDVTADKQCEEGEHAPDSSTNIISKLARTLMGK